MRVSSRARTPRSVLVRMRRPKPCFSDENRLRNLKFGEGIAAVVLQGADASGDNGVAGNGEGQAVDDDAGKLFAGNVHALPEACGGEQHGRGSVFEALEQNGTRRGALQQAGETDASAHALEEIVHLAVAGEEAEGAALAVLQQLHDFVGGLGGERRRRAHRECCREDRASACSA